MSVMHGQRTLRSRLFWWFIAGILLAMGAAVLVFHRTGPQPVTGCNADMVYKGAAPAAPAIYDMPLKRRADPPDWSEVEAPSPHK